MKRLYVTLLVTMGFISGVAFVYSCGGGSSSSGASVEELESRLALLEAKMAYVTVDTATINGLKGPHVIIEGANLHVRSGAGMTNSVNGLGNVVVGYNEPPLGLSPGDRDGSNNLVVGTANRYTSYGGLVAGTGNEISGRYSILAGGVDRTASADYKHDGMPDYDSGWQTVAAGDTLTLDHNLGGNVSDYLVSLVFNAGASINNVYTGGHTTYAYVTIPAPNIVASWRGAVWEDLTTSSITVRRFDDDTGTNYIRVRIWKYNG